LRGEGELGEGGGVHKAGNNTVTTKWRKRYFEKLEVQLQQFFLRILRSREETGIDPFFELRKKVDDDDVGAEVPGSGPGLPATTSSRILLAAAS
jgi:hypothetical protein